MKIPEYFNKESTHITPVLNTLSITGVSLVWGIMLELITPWWLFLAVPTILAAYGSEVKRRNENMSL
jgi:hypothetical protein